MIRKTISLLRGPIGPLMMGANEQADQLAFVLARVETAKQLLASGRPGRAIAELDRISLPPEKEAT